MLTLNGPQASASGVRAARWLIALPVVMLLFHLLLWLRYGTDLPFYDDWTGYVSGDIDSLRWSKLTRATNNTMSPVGYVLDALAQRGLGGNAIAYQFLSMLTVLGGLLWLQWRLLCWVLDSPTARAAAFALCVFMLQPGTYWGEQNLAYHQALPLLFLLLALDVTFVSGLRGRILGLLSCVLGLLAGFSYISGAVAALAAGACLLLMAALGPTSDASARQARWGGAGLLAAGLLALPTQIYKTRLAAYDDVSRHMPLTWPTEPDFWIYYLGKIGRSTGTAYSYAQAEFVLALLLAALLVWTFWQLAVGFRRTGDPQARRAAYVYLPLFLVVMAYVGLVAMGRAAYRDEPLGDVLSVFKHGYARFHYFWVTLLMPWMAATAYMAYAARRRRFNRGWFNGRGSMFGLLASIFVLAGTKDIFNLPSFYQATAQRRAAEIRCIQRQLGSGEPIRCDEFGFLTDWTPAYNYAKKIDASFIKYFPVVERAVSGRVMFDWKASADREKAVLDDMIPLGDGWYQGREDPRILIQQDQAAYAKCKALNVRVKLRGQQDSVLQVFYRQQGAAEFTELSSRRQKYHANPSEPEELAFLIESTAGFEPVLRIDPAMQNDKFQLQDIRVACSL